MHAQNRLTLPQNMQKYISAFPPRPEVTTVYLAAELL